VRSASDLLHLLEFKRVSLFLIYGIPGLLAGVAANATMVKVLNTNYALAYALALFVQVTVNFVVLRQTLFKKRKHNSVVRSYLLFLAGISGFRIVDWLLYLFFVDRLGWNFVLAQIFNAGLFAILKFKYSKKAFSGRLSPGNWRLRKL